MSSKRGYWSSKLGFYLAAVGSAFGLGNLWRFPYVVGENGGGAFVLIYVLFALLLGLPLLVGELILGKKTRKSVLGALKEVFESKKNFVWVAYATVFLTLVVLSYYALVSGWVLHYLTQFLKVLIVSQETQTASEMYALLSNPWLQSALTSCHLLIAMIVVFRGLENGFERFVSWTMPIFVVFVLLLAFKSLSLPSRAETLRFLFYPNFSNLTWASPLQAIGHLCFTLSVGFGVMVTFGSYLRDSDDVAEAGFRVTITDTLISIVAALLIFPIVLSASNASLKEPELLFQTVPQFFLSIEGGTFFGLIFFLCLYLAALGASIGIFEMIVSNIQEKFNLQRVSAVWITGFCAFVISYVPLILALADYSSDSLKVFDDLLINWFLPLSAMGLGLAVGWGLNQDEAKKYFVMGHQVETSTLFPYWWFFIRWFVPVCIVGAMCLFVIGPKLSHF